MRSTIGTYAVIAVVIVVIVWSAKSGGQAVAATSPGPMSARRHSRFPLLPPGSVGFRPGGIVLGRIGPFRVRLPATDSLMVFGPTRSGKTLTLALPLLHKFEGPVVVTSVKRDLYDRTVELRSLLGECRIFDLSDPASASWNIFSLIEDFKSAREVGDSLCRVTTKSQGDIEFWSRLASKLISPLLLAARECSAGLETVFGWLEAQDFDAVFEVLLERGHFEARKSLEGVVQLDQRTVSSILATALSLMEPYGDPTVSSLLSRDGIDLEELLDRSCKRTLYICSPLFQAERFYGAYELFLRRVMQVCYAKGPTERRILFLLDELANVAPIPELDRVASTCGSYGIVLVSIFQDQAQLYAAYGGRSGTVLNNHRSKLCLAGITDVATIDYVARIAGEHVKTREGPGQLLSLRPGRALFIEGNRAPSRIRLARPPRQSSPLPYGPVRSAARFPQLWWKGP